MFRRLIRSGETTFELFAPPQDNSGRHSASCHWILLKYSSSYMLDGWKQKWNNIFTFVKPTITSKSFWGEIRGVASDFNTTVMPEPVGTGEVAVYSPVCIHLLTYGALQAIHLQYLPPLLITSSSVSLYAAFTSPLSPFSPGAAITLLPLHLHLPLHPPLPSPPLALSVAWPFWVSIRPAHSSHYHSTYRLALSFPDTLEPKVKVPYPFNCPVSIHTSHSSCFR